jgi:hypothetical protein
LPRAPPQKRARPTLPSSGDVDPDTRECAAAIPRVPSFPCFGQRGDIARHATLIAGEIRVLMITGDHPRTAVRIAGDLGIVEPGARALTGAELEAASDEELKAALREVSVYARVAPEHKLRIVDALQANDEGSVTVVLSRRARFLNHSGRAGRSSRDAAGFLRRAAIPEAGSVRLGSLGEERMPRERKGET